jgi:hypothetical protein
MGDGGIRAAEDGWCSEVERVEVISAAPATARATTKAAGSR